MDGWTNVFFFCFSSKFRIHGPMKLWEYFPWVIPPKSCDLHFKKNMIKILHIRHPLFSSLRLFTRLSYGKLFCFLTFFFFLVKKVFCPHHYNTVVRYDGFFKWKLFLEHVKEFEERILMRRMTGQNSYSSFWKECLFVWQSLRYIYEVIWF